MDMSLMEDTPIEPESVIPEALIVSILTDCSSVILLYFVTSGSLPSASTSSRNFSDAVLLSFGLLMTKSYLFFEHVLYSSIYPKYELSLN